MKEKTTNEKNINLSFKHLRRKAELLLRFYMGLQQIKYRPYYYLTFLPVFFLFGIVWSNKDKLFTIPFLPSELLATLNIFISILLIIMLVLLLAALIKFFGIRASQWAEHKLIVAFDAKDLNKWGYPILISSKREKGKHILVMEFYSDIHLDRWQEKKPYIEEAMCIDIISIDYAREDKRNRKVIHAKLEGLKDNVELHDDKLDKELENID